MQHNPFPMGLRRFLPRCPPGPSPWGRSPRAGLRAHREGCSLPGLRLPPDEQSCCQDPQESQNQGSNAPGARGPEAGQSSDAHPAHGADQGGCGGTTAAIQGSPSPSLTQGAAPKAAMAGGTKGNQGTGLGSLSQGI